MKTNGSRIRDLRGAQGLTQEMLARLSGLSVRTVKASESGEIGTRSLGKLAAALNVEPMELLDDFAELPSLREFPRFLLQQVFPGSDHDTVDLLRRGAVAEIRSDFESARALFEEALETQTDDDLDSKAQVIIRCATALDNARRSREALDMLQPLLKDNRWQRVKPWIMKWLKYYIALAHRRIAENSDSESEDNLTQAEKGFREIQATGEPAQRIAATHQLGCVFWVRANRARSKRQKSTSLRQAVRHFEEARRRWQNIGNFREGYALRRLADIAEIQQHRLMAHTYLVDALEVFVRHDCYRYREEV